MSNNHQEGREMVFRGLAIATLFSSITLTAWWALAAAEDTETIPYHGHLQQNGQPFDGSVDITFSLWDDPVSTAMTNRLWSETQTMVTVTGGEFAVALGSVSGIGNDALDASDVFLQIQVGPTALSGRQRLNAVPFARRGPPQESFEANNLLVNRSGSGAQPSVELQSDSEPVGIVDGYPAGAGEGGLRFYSTTGSTPFERLNIRPNGNVSISGQLEVGYMVISTNGDGANTSRNAVCPAGTRVIGGGCNSTSGALQITASYPLGTNQWACSFTGAPANMVPAAYAICARIQ